jgi:hypothetical protein
VPRSRYSNVILWHATGVASGGPHLARDRGAIIAFNRLLLRVDEISLKAAFTHHRAHQFSPFPLRLMVMPLEACPTSQAIGLPIPQQVTRATLAVYRLELLVN